MRHLLAVNWDAALGDLVHLVQSVQHLQEDQQKSATKEESLWNKDVGQSTIGQQRREKLRCIVSFIDTDSLSTSDKRGQSSEDTWA